MGSALVASSIIIGIMQNFRDQVTRDVTIHTHHTGELLDLSGITLRQTLGLVSGSNSSTGRAREYSPRSRISMDDIPSEVAQRDIHAYMLKKLEGLSYFGSK